MRRGDIYFVARTYREDGSEQRANRPAVIVSNDKNNERSGTIEVVYMTTKPKKDLPTHVTISSAIFPSTVLCEQVHTVSKMRIGAKIGTLTAEELVDIDDALAISLGLSKEQTQTDDKTVPGTDNKTLIDAMCEVRAIITERDVYRKLYTDLIKSITKEESAK